MRLILLRRQYAIILGHIVLTSLALSAEVGSSRNSIDGHEERAIISDSLCFWPPDSELVNLSDRYSNGGNSRR